jgi:hypothetical protein
MLVSIELLEERVVAACLEDMESGSPESIRSALDRFTRFVAARNRVPWTIALEALARVAAARLAELERNPR